MREVKFLVTDESKRLARWLRLCGYDTAEAAARPFSELYRRAHNEGRVIVTRNRHLQARRLCRVIQVAPQALEAQLAQLARELELPIGSERAFTRCDRCNVALERVEKSAVQERVPPYVFQTQEVFHACPSCGRIYWTATHWERAQRLFDRVRQEASHA